MRVYLHAHRNPGPNLGVLVQEKLKGDVLGDRVPQRLVSGRDLPQNRRFGQARKPVKLGGLHARQIQKKRKKKRDASTCYTDDCINPLLVYGRREAGGRDP
jgi:hypothetical protein